MSKESLHKIVEKIKKLLALGESPNKEEAQAAIFRAQQLIEKYNIEEGLLEDEENKIVQITIAEFDSTYGIPYYYKAMCSCLADLFELGGTYGYNKISHGFITLVGPEITVEAAKTSFHLIDLAVAEEIKKLRGVTHYLPKNVIDSFKDGVANKFVQRVIEIVAERENNTSKEYGLILASNKSKIDEFMKQNCQETGTPKDAFAFDGPAYQAGKEAGDRISLHNNKPVDRSRLLK